MLRARRYFRWLFDLARPHLGNRVLEVGCGMGNFTNLLLDRELVVGIDVESECIRTHRNRFSSNPNIISMEMSASTDSFFPPGRYSCDSAVCLNVLEHIEDEQATLRNIRSVLSERGRLVLMVPAFPALHGPIDDLLGHYRRYTRRSLAKAARTAGFEPVLLRYMNSVGFFGWWMNAKVLKRTEQSEKQIEIFDSMIVPWLSKVEAIVPPPFGQSVFAVLEKRGSPGS